MRQLLLSTFMRQRMSRLDRVRTHPDDLQELWLKSLVKTAASTEWGRKYYFKEIVSSRQFSERVPIQSYEEYFPWIEKILKGEQSVLWPGRVKWFAKSSGTTNDKSKFIPVTIESLQDNHFRAGKDLFAQYFNDNPGSQMAQGYNLVIGGSHEVNRLNQWSRCGDLSAILLENLPFFYALFRTPPKEISLLGEWETKLEAIVKQVLTQDVRAITGVPTWLLVLFDRLFELKGIDDRNLLRIWPNMEVFFHGAVAFGPYRDLFKKIIPSEKMSYRETYNASEGFFAFQDEKDSTELLLLLDHGIYFEFIPVDGSGQESGMICSLQEVVLNQNYAIVLSTNGGLWRYKIGDTIRFTSIRPFRIQISGRTKHFINAFGEELIVDNAEWAIREACKQTGSEVRDYTAGPTFISDQNRGYHEWVIEFSVVPDSVEKFRLVLDESLQAVNSDYAAKRYQDMAMKSLILHVAPAGTFYNWMKGRGKLGGQNKVPRLCNTREYLDQLLLLL